MNWSCYILTGCLGDAILYDIATSLAVEDARKTLIEAIEKFLGEIE